MVLEEEFRGRWGSIKQKSGSSVRRTGQSQFVETSLLGPVRHTYDRPYRNLPESAELPGRSSQVWQKRLGIRLEDEFVLCRIPYPLSRLHVIKAASVCCSV